MIQDTHITLHQAMRVLAPRMSTMVNELRLTVESWNNRPDQWQLSLADRKARGLVLNRLWYQRIQSALTNDSGVQRKPNAGEESYLQIDQSFTLRLKSLSTELTTRNFPTKRSRHWESQLTLPGLPPGDRLDLGYRLDATGTSLEDMFVMFHINKSLIWIWQVAGISVDTFPIQFQLFDQPTPHEAIVAYSQY